MTRLYNTYNVNVNLNDTIRRADNGHVMGRIEEGFEKPFGNDYPKNTSRPLTEYTKMT